MFTVIFYYSGFILITNGYSFFILLMMQEPYFTEEQSFSLGAWWKFLNFVGKLGYIRILN